METNISVLLITALGLGVFHTLAGPDHYLPFVVLSKSRNWSFIKTINIVIVCGLGHVLSSVAFGFIGIGAGLMLENVEAFDGIRGNIAAWLLFSFGVAYTTWAVIRLLNKKTHKHGRFNKVKKLTFWILFTIFVFGPCEPLIPVLMYPAAESNYFAVFLIALVFGISTISTMLLSVVALLKGFSNIRIGYLEKYQHIMAGSVITLSGAGILFLGF